MAEVLAMFVRSVIYEQLDADGTLKTLLMSSDEHLIVALAGDYDEPRSGAFHFLLDDDEVRFSEKLTRCRRRKLGRNQFRSGDDSFEFSDRVVQCSGGRRCLLRLEPARIRAREGRVFARSRNITAVSSHGSA